MIKLPLILRKAQIMIIAALTQLMQKRNRVEYFESNGFQRTSNKVTCSVCKGKSHNSHTCKKSICKSYI